jgi:hypothetical protein
VSGFQRKSLPAQLRPGERAALALVQYPEDVERPQTRADCKGHEGPCPFVSCSHHLYLDVNPSGTVKINHPGREPWELKETCSLDVADRDATTLEEIGELLGLTRERIRQYEERILRKLRVENPDLAPPVPSVGIADLGQRLRTRR